MKKRLLSYLLASTIIFSTTGCTKKEFKNNNVIENYIQNTIDMQEFNSYLDQIDNIEVKYNHETFYFDAEDYKKLNEAIKSYTICDNDKKYSLIEIYSTILKNSNLIGELSPEKENLKIALDKAINKIFSQEDNINDDFCKLKDISLRIGILEENTLGQYNNEDLIITIDYNKIYKEYQNIIGKKITFIEYLSNVVEHELNHVRQYICDCRENDGQKNIKITYNNASCSLIEASAESQLYNNKIEEIKENDFSSFDYTYYSAREGQALILLMGLFKENFSLEEYYNAINETNLEKFHKIFELTTKEDFITFYKIKYAIDTLNYCTELYDYYHYLEKDTIGEIKEQTGNDYKVDIFKIVISDLIKEIVKRNLTFEESINLYNYVKSIIKDDEEKIYDVVKDITVYNERLLNGIKSIDEIFYEFLKEHFQTTQNEIIEQINDYNNLNTLDYMLDFTENKISYNQDSYNEALSLIKKYPLITEISFCVNAHSFYLKDFFKACENDYTKEKLLK